MKKLFLVLAVASLGFVACNNESTVDAAEQARLDSLKRDSIVKDSLSKLPPPPAPVQDSVPPTDSNANAPK